MQWLPSTRWYRAKDRLFFIHEKLLHLKIPSAPFGTLGEVLRFIACSSNSDDRPTVGIRSLLLAILAKMDSFEMGVILG
jgi:hypothetical protein